MMETPFALGEVSVSLSPQERFEEFLQSRNMRVTRERRAIVDEIFSRHEHFDADELLTRLQGQSDVPVSRPTVYRSLEVLVEAGLLRKMSLNGRAVYEHDYGYPQHDHLYCERCKQLIEFHSEELKGLREAVARAHQFRATGHRLIVYGVCRDCARPARRPGGSRLDRI
jgi:Fur family ferric uptake transcriptional regulator